MGKEQTGEAYLGRQSVIHCGFHKKNKRGTVAGRILGRQRLRPVHPTGQYLSSGAESTRQKCRPAARSPMRWAKRPGVRRLEVAWLFLPLINVVRLPGPSLARPVATGWMRCRRRSVLRRLPCLVQRTIQYYSCAVKVHILEWPPATGAGRPARSPGQFPLETCLLLLRSLIPANRARWPGLAYIFKHVHAWHGFCN